MQHKSFHVHGFAAFLALILAGFASSAGCGSADTDGETSAHEHGHDHEHGHRPASLHEAVADLEHIEQEVRSAIESGDVDAAHDPLHEVVELLEALPDVAAETDLPKAEWEAVKKASDRLFDAYSTIDKAFHVEDGDKQAALDQVASELTDALSEIRSRLPQTGEETDVHAHDHEEEHAHDHEDEHGHDHDSDDEAAHDDGGAES